MEMSVIFGVAVDHVLREKSILEKKKKEKKQANQKMKKCDVYFKKMKLEIGFIH